MLRIAAAFFLTLVVTPASAQDLQTRLQAALEEAGSPGMAVAVWSDGEVVAEAVAGVRAAGENAPIQKGDLWHLGSNTKAMTAVLAAKLIEQGRLTRDLTVQEALGDQIAGIDPGFRDATFAELFTHRAGAPARVGQAQLLRLAGTDEGRDAMADRLGLAERILTAEPEEPGEFLYSNAGYVVAAAMIEAQTGEEYEILMQDEVFAPLGLETAGFGAPGSADKLDQPHGHRSLFGVGPLISVPPGAKADNPPALSPAARAHMSLEDYLTFVGDQMACARGESGTLLSAESCDWLQTPVGDYAMGWGVSDGRWGHSGSNTMWLVVLHAWPHEDLAVVAAVNDGRLKRLQPVLAELAEAVASDYSGADAAGEGG